MAVPLVQGCLVTDAVPLPVRDVVDAAYAAGSSASMMSCASRYSAQLIRSVIYRQRHSSARSRRRPPHAGGAENLLGVDADDDAGRIHARLPVALGVEAHRQVDRLGLPLDDGAAGNAEPFRSGHLRDRSAVVALDVADLLAVTAGGDANSTVDVCEADSDHVQVAPRPNC